jgi:hypothetical protein
MSDSDMARRDAAAGAARDTCPGWPSPGDAPPGASARGRLFRLALAALAAAFVFVGTFPGPSAQVFPTLDGSWAHEINRLPHSRFAFGRDATFTYGPLGFLLCPADYGDNLVLAAWFRLIAQALLAVVVALSAVCARRTAGVAIAAVTLVVANALGLYFEYQLLLLVALMSDEALARGGAAWFAAAALVSAILLYVKTSLGVGAATTCGVAVLLWAVRRRRGALSIVVSTALAYAATLAIVAARVFPVPGDFVRWLRASLQIAGEYSVAMSLPGSDRDVAAAVALLVGYGAATAWLRWRRSPAADVALLLSAPLFLAFKHGFVRQDVGHEIAFFPFALAAAAVQAPRLGLWREWSASAAVWAGALASAVALLASAGFLWDALTPASLSGARGWHHVLAWVDLPAARLQHQLGRANLARDVVPGLRELVGREAVGIVPSELTYCAANDLECTPNPTLQLYAAYTAELDRETARHYAAPATAPRFVFAEFGAIDARNMILDTPATWRAIIDGYRVRTDLASPGRFLLERRAQPLSRAEHVVGTAQLSNGAWSQVPPEVRGLSARVPLDLTVGGKIAKALFRIPPVELQIVYCSGEASSYRLTPDTARAGLALSALPGNATEFGRMLSGALERRPLRIRLTGPGMRYYREPVEITFTAAGSASSRCEDARVDLSALRQLSTPPSGPLFYLDALGPASAPLDAGRQPVVLQRSDGWALVRGWAVDPAARRRAGGLIVTVDGAPVTMRCGEARSDVAEAFGVAGYADAGCSGVLLLDALAPGRHEVRFRVLSFDGRAYYAPDAMIRVVVR